MVALDEEEMIKKGNGYSFVTELASTDSEKTRVTETFPLDEHLQCAEVLCQPSVSHRRYAHSPPPQYFPRELPQGYLS